MPMIIHLRELIAPFGRFNEFQSAILSHGSRSLILLSNAPGCYHGLLSLDTLYEMNDRFLIPQQSIAFVFDEISLRISPLAVSFSNVTSL